MSPAPKQIRNAIEAADRRYSVASRALGITADHLRRLINRYRAQGEVFPNAKGGGWSAVEPGWEPTEDEIAAACEKFQAGWSEVARRQRNPLANAELEIPRVTLTPGDGQRADFDAEW